MNRKRTGSLVFFTMMAVLVVVAAIISNMIFVQYMDTLSIETTSDSQEQYNSFVVREEIMNAECATVRRGIFTMDAVQNGKLDCIGIPEKDGITVWFQWMQGGNVNTETYGIKPGGVTALDQLEDIPALIEAHVGFMMNSDVYPVLIWDSEQEMYYKAVVGYAGKIEENIELPSTGAQSGDRSTGTSADAADTTDDQTAADALYHIDWSSDNDTDMFLKEMRPDGDWERVPHPTVTSTHAMETQIPAGSQDGVSAFLVTAQDTEDMPEQAHVRYHVYLPAAYFPAPGNVILPGLAGTGNATGEWPDGGWNGHESTGDNGWSARLQLAAGTTNLRVYPYHAGADGETFGGTTLQTDQWHQIDQYVAMNTPGKQDGTVRVWVDGELVAERTDIQWRNNDRIKVESFWHYVRHGGNADVSLPEMRLYVDDIRVWDEEHPPERSENSAEDP